MKKIIDVIDVFQLPKFGLIISGIGPSCSSFDKETVKQSIGTKVLIKFSNGKEEIYEVTNKEVSFPGFSPDPHWNINICLGFDIELSTIEIGAKVYSL